MKEVEETDENYNVLGVGPTTDSEEEIQET